MSRSLWFVAGAGAGVYAAARARRAAEALTIDGLRDRVGAAVIGLRMVRDEVAQGRAEAEPELRRRMGVAMDRHTPRELDHPTHHTGLATPTPLSVTPDSTLNSTPDTAPGPTPIRKQDDR